MPALPVAWFGTRRRLAAAALVAVVLAAGSLVEIWTDASANGWPGPPGIAVVLALASILPILTAERWPLASALAMLAATAVLLALVAPHQGPFEPFVALLIGVYAVAARGRTKAGLLLVATCGVGGVAAVAAGAQHAGNVGPAVMWLAAAFLVGVAVQRRSERTRELEDTQQQLVTEREERARAAVAAERARIARELHDLVAHNVSVMVVHAGAATRTLDGDPPRARECLTTIERVGRDTVDELRRLLGMLRGPDEAALSPLPTLADVQTLIDQVRGAGVDAELTVEGRRDDLTAGLDVTGYRIVQEALTNMLKHAPGTRAQVTLRYARDALEITVVDDGSDVAARSLNGGLGLVGMRERVALYRGTFHAGPLEHGGYEIRARLPHPQSRP